MASINAVVLYFYSPLPPGYTWEMAEPEEIEAFLQAGWKRSPAHFTDEDKKVTEEKEVILAEPKTEPKKKKGKAAMLERLAND